MSDLANQFLFLPERASTFAERVDFLHYFVVGTTMVMSAGVGLAALFMFFRYRRREAHQHTEYVVPDLKTEFLFVSVPLVFFLAWFAIGFRDFTWYTTPPKDSMDVYVMGKQWMWKFSYPEGPNGVNVLHVPANRPVRLLITSRDVIHSFYVPSFRIKMDAVPGRYTQAWFEATKPGTYQVLCTEYCGLSHSKMLAEVVVLAPEDYENWLKEQQRGRLQDRQDALADTSLVPPVARMAEQGQKLVGTQGCLKCHSVDGSKHIGPTFLGMYEREEKLDDGQSIRVDEAYITQSMMDPGAHIVAGYQNVMPTYQGKLQGPESAAIVEYIKTLRTANVRETASEGPAYDPIQ
ncbi:cytochrome c oxidase subunit II [Corallococcus interemptor]|uniref:cytochrome c oxidase subunit II n=1 Tax=Corallococcus TaxID=83461 RepID=UPI001CC0B7B3|nr:MULTISPECIES: cytochrome c oxidase subunit II [unclassified Corallococcus]MBZ4330409.1 cytochrome c oxidase subunit II [Corallococcus sp. AS-1-12]MBZ4373553.1 cytochrome c oxidase subunit II [Corallococcus sp. AS-1-6]